MPGAIPAWLNQMQTQMLNVKLIAFPTSKYNVSKETFTQRALKCSVFFFFFCIWQENRKNGPLLHLNNKDVFIILSEPVSNSWADGSGRNLLGFVTDLQSIWSSLSWSSYVDVLFCFHLSCTINELNILEDHHMHKTEYWQPNSGGTRTH